MTNTIVPTEVAAVNLVDTTKAAYQAAVTARNAAFAATLGMNTTPELFQALRSATVAQERARVAWTAASDALQAMWRAADAEYDAFICAQYDALEMDYDGFDDHAYQLTPEGVQYLDRHYATHSNA